MSARRDARRQARGPLDPSGRTGDAAGDAAGDAVGDGWAAHGEWPVKIVDVIDTTVAGVRDRVVRPVIVAARAVVFGLLVATMGVVVVVLVSVAAVRLLDVYAFGGRVWAADALLGTVMGATGLWLWSLRSPRHPEGDQG